MHQVTRPWATFAIAAGIAIMTSALTAQGHQVATQLQFQQLQVLPWESAFHDDGTGSWQDGWFLDGLRATVRNTPDGMILAAGPIARDHASHCVLWTKASFAGDVKIEFDYWRLDTIQRWVNILYIQATGTGQGPYSEDISTWSTLREIPYMRMYFNHMNLLHVSFAAFDPEDEHEDYVRARRYPTSSARPFNQLALRPDNFDTGLFKPGVAHHFTVIKRGDLLIMQVANDERTALFSWDASAFDPITHGRIGFRHMFTRAARYANITISTLDP